MPPKKRRQAVPFIICLFATVMASLCAQAQDAASLKQLIVRAENYREAFPTEKLYLKTDRDTYSVGDTVWLKAYLFNASTYTPSQLSSKIYVELINDSAKVVQRFALPLSAGMGYGQIHFDEKLRDGNYVIRAYSNWMQNFSRDAFATKAITVRDVYAQDHWLVAEQHTLRSGTGGTEADLVLRITDLTRMPVPYRDVEVQVNNGDRNIFRTVLTTSDVGNLKTTIPLPEKKKTASFIVTVTDKFTKKKLMLPLFPGGGYSDIDLQFMPEGGAMINGLPSRVGFKAIGEDGLGVGLKGTIVDDLGHEVNTFGTTHLGMGTFVVVPQAGRTYFAKYDLGAGSRTTPLPTAQTAGLALRADALSSPDTIFVAVRTTPDVAALNKRYELIAHSADAVYYGSLIRLSAGFTRVAVPKSILRSGIISFTVLDGNLPVASRRVFVDHNDRLQLTVTASRPQASVRDSVALTVNVCDPDGKPVRGNFAVSVTDDALNNPDPNADNIASRLLLSSELFGFVENAGWYLRSRDAEHLQALDVLMMCQGWQGLDWAAVSTPITKPRFLPEQSEQLTGNLRTLFKKPIKNAHVKLFTMSKKYGLILMDTASNDKGEFGFYNLPVLDTISYTLRVVKAKGGESIPNIKLNEFVPAQTDPSPVKYLPWYTIANDTSLNIYLKGPKPERHLAGIDPKDVKGKLLKEVTIKGRKADIQAGRYQGYVIKQIKEEELVKARKGTLLDLLLDRVKMLNVTHLYKDDPFGRPAMHPQEGLAMGMERVADILVDGQSSLSMMGMSSSDEPGVMMEMLNFLRYMTADEVKDIRVAGGYYYFISVTTRSGNGYFTSTNNNIVKYDPVPFCLPQQFYRPKYTVLQTAPLPARPTLHWEPNLVTDQDGNATLSFYAADKPGKYTVLVEGADMNGNFGSRTSEIVIKRQ